MIRIAKIVHVDQRRRFLTYVGDFRKSNTLGRVQRMLHRCAACVYLERAIVFLVNEIIAYGRVANSRERSWRKVYYSGPSSVRAAPLDRRHSRRWLLHDYSRRSYE